ncbi:MAG: histidine triad nucleotide-binding protein [Actinobacteria bacterium]|nr:histidine triad nucleotide-binding protein [Actinomycetota bacterium]
MEDCLFCKIINRKVKGDIIFENDDVLIFKDINPKAPVHLLAVPKQHVNSIVEIEKLSPDKVMELFKAIAKVSKEMKLEKDGFRVVTNTGTGAGQSVEHLHFHIMGKRVFNWPPG